jgi:hypothetical protein
MILVPGHHHVQPGYNLWHTVLIAQHALRYISPDLPPLNTHITHMHRGLILLTKQADIYSVPRPAALPGQRHAGTLCSNTACSSCTYVVILTYWQGMPKHCMQVRACPSVFYNNALTNAEHLQPSFQAAKPFLSFCLSERIGRQLNAEHCSFSSRTYFNTTSKDAVASCCS